MDNAVEEKRSEERTLVDLYYSVEFSVRGVDCVYQFKIRDRSPRGIGVLVREDSEVLKHLKVGDVLEVKYYRTDSSMPNDYFETEIRHIDRDEEGKFRGHCFVGLKILKNLDPP